MNAIDRITKLLEKCGTPTGVVPPTELYNEGWMLRLVLDWFASHSDGTHALSFLPGSRWFSEAQLPSAFLPRTRPDDKASIRAKVSRRVEVYRDSSEDYGTRAVWLNDWCLPVLDRIEIEALSWESIVTFIGSADQSAGRDISAFYEKCLAFNDPNRTQDS
jgi:hypothetical protein